MCIDVVRIDFLAIRMANIEPVHELLLHYQPSDLCFLVVGKQRKAGTWFSFFRKMYPAMTFPRAQIVVGLSSSRAGSLYRIGRPTSCR